MGRVYGVNFKPVFDTAPTGTFDTRLIDTMSRANPQWVLGFDYDRMKGIGGFTDNVRQEFNRQDAETEDEHLARIIRIEVDELCDDFRLDESARSLLRATPAGFQC